MKKNLLFAITFIFAGLVLVSCNTTKKLTATEKQNIEKKYEVAVGKTQNIELSSNASTGYKWALVGDTMNKKILELSKQEYKEGNTSTSMVGAGGTEIFTFKGVKKGVTYVKLEYKKEGEAAEKTKIFEFEVK